MTGTGETPRITVPVPAELVMRDPARLRWGTVSTIKAPLCAIARFAAWHLDLGASEVYIFLDEPDALTEAFFAPHPAIHLTRCDDAYWRGKPERARSSHQLRQAFNASRCYRKADVHWLAHIDVDEFLLCDEPLAPLLAAAPDDAAFVNLRPAEMLAQPDPWNGESYYKRPRREAGLTRSEMAGIYPEFGAYVPEGFLGYDSGKNIARTGLPDIRFGIHGLKRKGAKLDNGQLLTSVHVGHAHAPTWEIFRHHFEFRMQRGSYRKEPDDPMRLQDVFEVILEAEGETGLRRFYDEMCAATPGLLQRLRDNGLLLTARMDLDAKVARWFGDLPA